MAVRNVVRRLGVAAVLAGVVGAGGLTACSADKAAGGGDGAAANAETKAEITYAVWDENQVPALKQNIADFNKQYPNIQVTVDVTPWSQYWTKLQTQATSGTLPDVFWMNGPNVKLYAANGQLEPLTELIADGAIDPKNYPESLNNLYSFDGTQYGVPKDFDTIGVWVNKAILARADVPLPSKDWTWDDLRSAANTVSSRLGAEGIYGIAAAVSGGQETYYNTILQAGGEVISADGKKSGYDSPEAIAGIQFWADLLADGAMPTQQQLSDTPANAWFTSGKAAFFFSGNWSTAELSESSIAADIVAVPLPQGKRKATVIHGLGNVLSADGKHKPAAKAFLAYLGSQEAQQTQADMKAANPAFNNTQQAFVDSVPNFDLQIFLDAQEYSFPYPSSQHTAVWVALENELLPDAFSGKRPVADVAKELATKMNEALAKE